MQEPLVTVEIEEAATRPPMFMGLIPAKIAGLLFLIGTLALILTDPYQWEAAELIAIVMIFFGIKPLVARDYHDFWVRLDFLCLDTHWQDPPFTRRFITSSEEGSSPVHL